MIKPAKTKVRDGAIDVLDGGVAEVQSSNIFCGIVYTMMVFGEGILEVCLI